jgi:serine/threonine protein kinase
MLGKAAIVHRDLASRNVLIDEDLGVKVADFVRCLLFSYNTCVFSDAIGSPTRRMTCPSKWLSIGTASNVCNPNNINLMCDSFLIMSSFNGVTTLKGLSREMDSENPDKAYYRLQTDRPMPIRWMAPEAVSSAKFDSKSDVYSFGILAFEVFSFGAFPFNKIASDMKFLQELVVNAKPTALLNSSGSVGSGVGAGGVGARAAPSVLIDMLMEQIKTALTPHAATLPLLVERVIRDCTAPDPGLRPSFATLVQTTNPRAVATALVRTDRPLAGAVQEASSPVDLVATDAGGGYRSRTHTFC